MINIIIEQILAELLKLETEEGRPAAVMARAHLLTKIRFGDDYDRVIPHYKNMVHEKMVRHNISDPVAAAGSLAKMVAPGTENLQLEVEMLICAGIEVSLTAQVVPSQESPSTVVH